MTTAAPGEPGAGRQVRPQVGAAAPRVSKLLRFPRTRQTLQPSSRLDNDRPVLNSPTTQKGAMLRTLSAPQTPRPGSEKLIKLKIIQEQAGHSWASTTATYTTVGQDARNRMLRAALAPVLGEGDGTRWHGRSATTGICGA